MRSLPVEIFIKDNRSAKSGGKRRSSHKVFRNAEFHPLRTGTGCPLISLGFLVAVFGSRTFARIPPDLA
jgi:hypothetical protein